MKKRIVLKNSDKLATQIIITVWVTFCTVFALIPLFITLINAIKTNNAVERSIFAFPQLAGIFSVISHNFSTAWQGMSGAFLRSIFVTILGSIGDCMLGAILAYLFTYKKFPFKNILYMMFISVMLLPSIMGMPILVPFMVNTLKLGDTYVGYLLPNFAGGQVTALFLFRTFFGQQPKSIYESAKIEGANDANILVKITIPLAIPIILYKFVGTFASLYNDFLWPSLIFNSKLTLMPKMLALQEVFTQGQGTSQENGAMYAMYIISSVPLIFTSAISMRFFSSGNFAAGMKL